MSASIGASLAKLLSSSLAAQALFVLTSPVLSRLFSPEHFGVMQSLESIAGFFFVIVCLKYELSIPLGKNSQEAGTSVVLSLLAALLVSAASLLFVALGGAALTAWFNMPALRRFLWMIPLFVFLHGLERAMYSWTLREGAFSAIACSELAEVGGERSVTLSWGLIFLPSVWGLLLGRLFGSLAKVLLLFRLQGWKMLKDIRAAGVDLNSLRELGGRHKKFLFFRTWGGLLHTVSLHVMPLIFGHYFPPLVLGYYALARKAVTLPLTLLGNTIARVFFPLAARECHDAGKLSQIVGDTFLRLVQFGIFPMVTLGFFGAELFAWVFGAPWREAGVYGQLFAPWQFFGLLSFPLDIYALVNRQELGLLINGISFAGRTSALMLGLRFGGPRTAIVFYVLFSIALLIGNLSLKLRLARVSRRWAAQTVVKYSALAVFLLLPSVGLSCFLKDLQLSLGAVLLAAFGYAAIVVRGDAYLRQVVTQLFNSLRRT